MARLQAWPAATAGALARSLVEEYYRIRTCDPTRTRFACTLLAESPPESGWRPAVRFVASVIAAGGVTRLLWAFVPNQLSVSTRLVGYQTLNNFDIFRYTYGYYVLAFVFPALTIAMYATVSWRGPLRKTPPVTRRILPVNVTDVAEQSSSDRLVASSARKAPLAQPTSAAETGASPETLSLQLLWTAGRVLLPAAVIALEVSCAEVTSDRISSTGLLAALGYTVAVLLLATGFVITGKGRHRRRQATWNNTNAVSRANSLLAICVVPLLLLVSEGSTVFISSQHRLVHYDWLPVWLAVVGTLGCLATWVWVVGRRHDAARDPEYEARVLTWLVGPVAVFAVSAGLAGPLGRFIGYDDAQFLATPQLIFHHGLYPCATSTWSTASSTTGLTVRLGWPCSATTDGGWPRASPSSSTR